MTPVMMSKEAVLERARGIKEMESALPEIRKLLDDFKRGLKPIDYVNISAMELKGLLDQDGFSWNDGTGRGSYKELEVRLGEDRRVVRNVDAPEVGIVEKRK